MSGSPVPPPSGFVAINSHHHHSSHDITEAMTSTAEAVRYATMRCPSANLHIALFTEGQPAPGISRLANDLGIEVMPQVGRLNGPNLNAQIDWARAKGYALFYRVDADDLVSRDRFFLQSQLMADPRIDLSGGGLVYRDRQTAQQSLVLPPRHPRPLDFLTNLYVLHPTLCLRLQTVAERNLSYWGERLEDKELAAQAFAKGILPVNDQAIYGTYNLDRNARASAQAARLNLKLNLQFLRAAQSPWLVPLALAAHAGRRTIGAHAMRQFRNRLYAQESGSSLTQVQQLPMKKEQKENS